MPNTRPGSRMSWLSFPNFFTIAAGFSPLTLFWNGSCAAYSQYPNGVADAVGYWAGTEIFEGVTVSGRAENGQDVSSL